MNPVLAAAPPMGTTDLGSVLVHVGVGSTPTPPVDVFASIGGAAANTGFMPPTMNELKGKVRGPSIAFASHVVVAVLGYMTHSGKPDGPYTSGTCHWLCHELKPVVRIIGCIRVWDVEQATGRSLWLAAAARAPYVHACHVRRTREPHVRVPPGPTATLVAVLRKCATSEC